MKISCIVVDDEPLARKGIAEYVEKVDFFDLKATCVDAISANGILGKVNIDLIFLDIQMPELTGLDFLKSLTNPPMVIITTAYPNYALEGYSLNVMDYLVKPISMDRFLQAANKTRDYFNLLNKTSNPESDYFFVKCENKFERISLLEILYIEAMQNYVTIYSERSKFMTLMTMKQIESYLPEDRFIRVQKSYIVPFTRIEAIEGNELKIGAKRISISRNNRDEILNRILKGRVLKKLI